MKRLTALFLVSFSVCIFSSALDKTLFNHIEYQLSSKRYNHVSLGIVVDHLSGFKKTRLYEKNSQDLFIPASTIKPLVSLAVLNQFGKNYQFKTLFMGDSKIEEGVLNGHLYIKGMGDPSLQREDLIKIVLKLKDRGLTRIEGNIIYDPFLFESAENTKYENVRYYNAPSSALSIDYNQVHLVVNQERQLSSEFKTSYVEVNQKGAVYLNDDVNGFPWPIIKLRKDSDYYIVYGDVTYKDQKDRFLDVLVTRPGLFFSTQFKELCERYDIEVVGSVVKGKIPNDHHVLLVYKGSKLEDIIKELNQESNNVVAKILNQDLAAFRDVVPASKQDGVNILSLFCTQTLKFKPDSFILEDASGLSLKNRISPDHLSLMLHYIYKKKYIRDVMMTSFAKLGEHKDYQHITPPSNLDVYVKTGTLSSHGVNSVIGYIFNQKTQEMYSFSILTDHQKNEAYKGRLTYPILRGIFQALDV